MDVIGYLALAVAATTYGASHVLFGGWHPHRSRDRVLFMAAMTLAALFLPPNAAMVLLLGLLLANRALWWFAASTLAINTVLLGFLTGVPTWSMGLVTWSEQGAWLGFIGAVRITAILLWNGFALANVKPAWFLEGLALGPRATAYAGSIWLAMTGLQEDAKNLHQLQKIQGTWPASRRSQLEMAVQWIPVLLRRSHQRALARQDALQLAGIGTPTWFAPFVAITALAAAGRIALVAIPNIALTYVFVFIGGLLYGARLGAAAAAVAMAGTNLLLSGLAPTSFVNVPAMALVGLLGGVCKSIDFSGRNRALAAAIGFLATMLFSVAADTFAWAVIPEFRGSAELLQVRVVAGLAFNLVPAVVNGALFAAVAGPAQQAHGKPER